MYSSHTVTYIIKLQKRREDFTYGRSEEGVHNLGQGA